jgi:hypothetical protein
MERTITPWYYVTEQHYTGYFPTPDISGGKVGNGVAIIDNTLVNQGEFGRIEGFPNGGEDFYSPSALLEYDVYTFGTRLQPEED